jgi:hypothetical protein
MILRDGSIAEEISTALVKVQRAGGFPTSPCARRLARDSLEEKVGGRGKSFAAALDLFGRGSRSPYRQSAQGDRRIGVPAKTPGSQGDAAARLPFHWRNRERQEDGIDEVGGGSRDARRPAK